MAVTQLSPSAVPGRRYSFSPKTAAGGGRGAGPFTILSVMALPGMRRAFVAKTPYTEPEVTPTPTPAPAPTPVGGGYVSMPYPAEQMVRLYREDEEITEFIMAMVQSGILDN